mmetsp:Transcript_1613/g.4660  ORF Transcript_1613/g.4660 Transcript_1613/m.4660 type:complete len:122 (-) Transcript_1613:372-737(-)
MIENDSGTLIQVLPMASQLRSDSHHGSSPLMGWLSSLNGLGLPDCGKNCPAANVALSLPIYLAVLGCIVGAWPLPMDWATGWQVWPTSLLLCAACGSVLGHFLAAAYFLLCRKTSRRQTAP